MKSILAYLVLAIIAALPCRADDSQKNVYQSNLIVVVDASGSMDDPIRDGTKNVKKMDAAKRALKQVLAKVDNNTNVGIFVFSSSSSNDNPFPLGPKDINKINSVIDAIRPAGGTPLGEYIQKAANQALKQRDNQLGYGQFRILVVTDGEASDAGVMRKAAPETLKRGLRLDVIGVGMNSTHELAKMSSSYRSANDSQALDAALTAVVAETSAPLRGQSSTNDDFALISHLPDEACKVILTGLYTNENQPLFEKPKKFEAQPKATSQAIPTSTPTAAPVTSNSTPPMGLWIIIGAVVVVIVLIAVVVSANS